MKEPMFCEIITGSLDQEIEGKSPFTLQTGDTYVRHVGMVEKNQNKGTEVAVMRIIRLRPPA